MSSKTTPRVDEVKDKVKDKGGVNMKIPKCCNGDYPRGSHDDGLSGMSGLQSNPANRQIASSSRDVGAPRFFFSIFFIFFLKKLEKTRFN
jgi:hypothetical protein